MGEYFGIAAIATRLGLHPQTVKKRIYKGFLAYKRRPQYPAPGQGFRLYYTNDDLIRIWEVQECLRTQKEIGRKRAARAKRKADAQAKANEKRDP